MTKHYCDTCGKEMESSGIKALPAIRYDIGTKEKPKPCCTGRLSDFRNAYGAREWSESPPSAMYQFDTSYVSVCAKCVLRGFKQAVAALKED